MIDEKLLGVRSVSNIKRGRVLLIYGEAGAGKTTLLDTLNEPTLLINLDCGEQVLAGEHIRVFDLITPQGTDITKIKRFEGMAEILLKETELPYKYVVIDNVSELQDAYNECLQAQRGVKYPRQLDYRDTGIEIKRWLRRLRNLTYKGVNVIYIAWEDTAKIEDIGGTVQSEKLPMIMGKTCRQIMGLVDFVGVLRVSKKGDRFLQFDSDSKYLAKKREEPGLTYDLLKEGKYLMCPEGATDTLQKFFEMIQKEKKDG